MLVLLAIFTGSFRERKDFLSGRAKLMGKSRGLLQHSKVHGGVVELQENGAQLFVVFLKLLNTFLEVLDGILLPTSISSLG